MFKKLAATGILGFAVAGSALAATPAYADAPFGHNHTSGNNSVLGGTQVIAPISIPVTACGNAVAVVGLAGAGCQGKSAVNFGH